MAELIPPCSVLPVMDIDRLQRGRVERDQVMVEIVKAENDARFRVAPGLGASHQVGLVDLLQDRHHSMPLPPTRWPSLALAGGAVVLPGRALSSAEPIRKEQGQGVTFKGLGGRTRTDKCPQIVSLPVAWIEVERVVGHVALEILYEGAAPIVNTTARLIDEPHFARNPRGKGVRLRPFGMRLKARPRVLFE